MIRELEPNETSLAHAAMLELRPRVGTAAAFTEYIDTVQRPEGYRLVAAFVDGESEAVAVAGFRLAHHLHWRRAIYCDDLDPLGVSRTGPRERAARLDDRGGDPSAL